VDPDGVEPSTKRIQAQFQFGYNLTFIWKAIVNLAGRGPIPMHLHFSYPLSQNWSALTFAKLTRWIFLKLHCHRGSKLPTIKLAVFITRLTQSASWNLMEFRWDRYKPTASTSQTTPSANNIGKTGYIPLKLLSEIHKTGWVIKLRSRITVRVTEADRFFHST